jgi:hypothetical protein
MVDETAEKKTLWDKTKTWAKENPVLTGAAAGFAAGTAIPGLGNVVGAVGGGVIGYLHAKSQGDQK